jgi:quinoprotein glucose dehydrogenase
MTRTVARSPIGALCNPPPWGVMVAVDLKAGKILWQSTVGTAEEKNLLGLPMRWGTPLVNGVLVTGGGLVFTGALDAYLRAFDAKTGAELWQGRLPVPGFANPMTYTWEGEQYIVIGAGGIPPHNGESVVAFRLARANETPSLWSRTIDRPGGRFYASMALIFGVISVSVGLVVAWRHRAQRLNRTA